MIFLAVGSLKGWWSMKRRVAALAVPFALGLGGCGDTAAVPEPVPLHEQTSRQQQDREGTGLVLDSLTGLAVPLVGPVGEVVIDQAIITNFALVEDLVGQIVGLEAEGVLQLTAEVLGTDVVTEDFVAVVSVTSTGPGQCELVSIDLGPIAVEALGLASVATLTGRGSGALGILLCNLGNLLGGLTGGAVVPGAQGVVNAINNQL
jgi:hypothetical protein